MTAFLFPYCKLINKICYKQMYFWTQGQWYGKRFPCHALVMIAIFWQFFSSSKSQLNWRVPKICIRFLIKLYFVIAWCRLILLIPGQSYYFSSAYEAVLKDMTTLETMTQYGPVTMIVPAPGHQVRCIPWVQMGTINKEIGFYVD